MTSHGLTAVTCKICCKKMTGLIFPPIDLEQIGQEIDFNLVINIEMS